jgi:predicted ABC-type ATPase
VASEESFAFETTLSGTKYAERIKRWKERGYEVIIYYLHLPSAEMAIDRAKSRVAQGGHDVPEQDIRRRFERGWRNFKDIYRDLADGWIILDTSEHEPKILEESR